jgi:hypothetical protein
MKPSKPPLPLHPFLISIFPVLSLLASNLPEVRISDSYRSFIMILASATVLLILLKLLLRDWGKAAILSSLYFTLFFSYGHIYAALKGSVIAGLQIGSHRYLIIIWLIILAAGTWYVIKWDRPVDRATRILNILGIVLLIQPGFILVSSLIETGNQSPTNGFIQSHDPETQEISAGEMPDIYYLIVDAYAREDILRDQFNHNNSAFINFLEDRGFYVAEGSTSNYLHTYFSLTSSLNMDYVQNLEMDLSTGELGVFVPYIKQSLVRRQLEALGYSTVAFATGWVNTEIEDADYFIAPEMGPLTEFRIQGGLNAFETMLIHTSMGKIISDLDRLPLNRWLSARLKNPYDVQREIILMIFDRLTVVPSIPGPKFVFAHILSPHSPYLFDSDGSEVDPEGPFTLSQTDSALTGTEGRVRYRNQLIYINTRVEEVIDAILANSERLPIIILQSDHGPGEGFSREDPNLQSLEARSAILNAYLLPSDCNRNLYPTITPVNTFRIIFNCYFGSSYELLDEITYFDDIGSHGFELIPVDEVLDSH